MKLTDYFERVLILNLSYKPRRKDRLSAHLDALQLVDPARVTWVRAVSGDMCPPPAYFLGGNGAWGCLQTHSRAVQDAVMDRAASCLVLEDDVLFHPQSAALLERLLLALPADWGQVYLGGQHLKEPEETAPGSVVWRAGNINRTHAYALHRRAYERFLQHIHHAPDYIEHGGWHIDHQLGLAHERKLWNTYCPSWWLAGQAAGESNISGRTNAELWWQPARYARHLPFIFVPAQIEPEQKSQLQEHVHFGWNLKPDTFTDVGLDQVATGYKGLGEWMKMIGEEALSRHRLPGICHADISLESARRQWPQVHALEDEPDLAGLRTYPANGLFDNPLMPPPRSEASTAPGL